MERLSLRRVCLIVMLHIILNTKKTEGLCDKCKTKLLQREDDQPDRIVSRMKEYNRTIGPILDVYKERGILIEIDASPSIRDS